MKFMDMMEEWMELREKGPDESYGYTDKSYYRRLYELRHAIDRIIPGDYDIIDGEVLRVDMVQP